MNHLTHIACRWTLALIALFVATFTATAQSATNLTDSHSNGAGRAADTGVSYSSTTPATGKYNIDVTSFNYIGVSFPEASADNLFAAPEGICLTDPLGNDVPFNPSFGFIFWAGTTELRINFADQFILGTYTLTIPADALTFASGNRNKAITLQWTLTGTKFQFGYYNSYETLKSFERFALSAPEGVTLASSTLTTLRHYVGYDPDTYDPIFDNVPVDVTLSGNTALFTFATPFTAKAGVSLTIPAGTIKAADGRTNREISVYQEVDPVEYIDILSYSPAPHDYNIYGPIDHIVLTLDRPIAPDDVLAFGKTITINGREVPVTASILADQLIINFDKDRVRYGDYNQFGIPEGFLTTHSSCLTQALWMNNVYLQDDGQPLAFLGVQPGFDAPLVTTPGAEVEKMGIIILQFDEPIDAASNADTSTVTVYDETGSPCTLYAGGGWLTYDNVAETNAHTFTLWVYPDRTDAGTYTLHVPAGTFVGLESGMTNTDILFPLVIADIDTFRPTTSIADGATVTALTDLVLTAPEGITFDHFTDYPANFFCLTGDAITGDGKIINQATIAPDGKTATLHLGNVTAAGDYVITVPKGYLRSTAPIKGNAELTIHVTVGQPTLRWDVDGNGEINAADVLRAVAVVLEGNDVTDADKAVALRVLDLDKNGVITISELTRLIAFLRTGSRPPRPE